jgi:hypothetical protein
MEASRTLDSLVPGEVVHASRARSAEARYGWAVKRYEYPSNRKLGYTGSSRVEFQRLAALEKNIHL